MSPPESWYDGSTNYAELNRIVLVEEAAIQTHPSTSRFWRIGSDQPDFIRNADTCALREAEDWRDIRRRSVLSVTPNAASPNYSRRPMISTYRSWSRTDRNGIWKPRRMARRWELTWNVCMAWELTGRVRRSPLPMTVLRWIIRPRCAAKVAAFHFREQDINVGPSGFPSQSRHGGVDSSQHGDNQIGIRRGAERRWRIAF
jgi:hypothetical protein